MSPREIQSLSHRDDPYRVLDVRARAGDAEIRAAYLRKVKEHPPDRSPDEFERIRDAYELLRDPARRVRWQLFSIDPRAPFSEVLAALPAERCRIGPGPWLAHLARDRDRDRDRGGQR
jgi:preprotein translocase subunit Sec63